MNLDKTLQANLDNLENENYDIFITASGFESRARFIAESYKIKAARKICFGFIEYQDNDVRKQNDNLFNKLGFEYSLASGNDSKEIIRKVSVLIDSFNKKEIINILIDYSSMTRIWYAAVIKLLKFRFSSTQKINIFFCYSFSKFVPPPNDFTFNKYVGPIDGFYNITLPNKPSALIIGLGYVEARAYGLAEFFDVEPYLFIADASANESFFKTVVDVNKNLIASINEENIFTYPILNLKHTETLLFHIVKDLLDNYRLVLAPCGPKPFTLLCLLTALRFENVDVWRISAGEVDPPIDKNPNNEISLLRVTFA